jgi:hypothetical protein
MFMVAIMSKEIQSEMFENDKKPILEVLRPIKQKQIVKGEFILYKNMQQAFTLTDPSVDLLRKFKYEHKLTIIPKVYA